ncbi:MAG TPA: Dam family site-specific DNA-(adenine-N6)-methyltransferase [Chroococcales cyanobacterium]
MKPFLKWAGNKYSILERIAVKLPSGQRLIEPFVGAGAVFLNTNYRDNLLADNNPDLIDLYRALQKEGRDFIEYCRSFFDEEHNEEACYYKLRETFNTTEDRRFKAALFLYLNRHGYNGLCRYNAKGIFNTPFGRYKKPYFPAQEMLSFHQKSKDSLFLCADFAETMGQAQPGDVIYCDPPYVPLSPTANFTSYSTGGFGEQQQLELAKIAEELAMRGIPVLISNHDTPFVREAYAAAKMNSFEVQRYISCRGDHRNKAKEVLALFKQKRKRKV